MWQVAEFEPAAFFSLRPANATTSGGKSLVAPSPYAVKMALLDAAIRIYGRAYGEQVFPVLRDLQVSVRLPDHLVVIHTFVKILRPHKNGPKDVDGSGLVGPFGNTIAYRELVNYGGTLYLATRASAISNVGESFLGILFSQINYIGKRGGFIQFMDTYEVPELPADFTLLNPGKTDSFPVGGLLQLMDDCGPEMTFADADIYSGKMLAVGKRNGRILQPVVLPYRSHRSNRSYTFYRKIG
jgi:hypothetical protein